MIIAISGTPATGKTTLARELAKRMDANLISIHNLVRSKKIPSAYDKERRTKIVDVGKLRSVVKKMVEKNRINIVDGHLSHLIDANVVIILRCRPDVLIKRMKKKKWARKKISENVQAEILDVVTIEALSYNRKGDIIEIDASGMTTKPLSSLVITLLKNKNLREKYRPGRIDWSEKFAKYFIESVRGYKPYY